MGEKLGGPLGGGIARKQDSGRWVSRTKLGLLRGEMSGEQGESGLKS